MKVYEMYIKETMSNNLDTLFCFVNFKRVYSNTRLQSARLLGYWQGTLISFDNQDSIDQLLHHEFVIHNTRN